MQQVRLVSSGTEATMSAIRLARGATGRDLVLKFEGCYHGHSDALLAEGAGSGLATLGIPGSPGVTRGAAADTLTAPFNDLDAVAAIMGERGGDVAVIVVEPVAANMGVIPPEPGFLQGLRRLCDEHGALLFFDEVITGFRIAFGGAQSVYGVKPDLTALGKVMGGGFPCAAFGGSVRGDGAARSGRPRVSGRHAEREPRRGRRRHRGAATRGTDRPVPRSRRDRRATDRLSWTRSSARRASTRRSTGRDRCSASSSRRDRSATSPMRARPTTRRYARFFHGMLDRGVYLPPSGYELWTLSAALEEPQLARLLSSAREAAADLDR